MLDDDLNPHISDCWFADLIPNQELQVSVCSFLFYRWQVSKIYKSDKCPLMQVIYSYNLMLLFVNSWLE